jgi:hypothetical protein
MGELKEDDYIRDMGYLWEGSIIAMQRLGVTDAIFFPFGMGAFLRNLDKNDESYKSASKIRTLKFRVCMALMEAIKKLVITPGISPSGLQRIHLCLFAVGEEAIGLHNSFIEAAAEMKKTCPDLSKVLVFQINCDALQVSRELAAKMGPSGSSLESPKVGLLNGANRKMIGNHWFAKGAKFAIDENIHRRSCSMARFCLLINQSTDPQTRPSNYLANRMQELGGKVEELPDLAAVAGSATPASAKSSGKSTPPDASAAATTKAAAKAKGSKKP